MEQRTLVTYAVLAGLTPMIPVPFLDDAAKVFFRRRMVRALAEARGVALAPEAVEALIREPEGCFLRGCLVDALLYVPRKLLAKLFFFLEWKRALDLTSQTYHFGFLVDCALQEGLLRSTGGRTPEVVREAIREVCREAPIRPVEAAVAAAFRQSRAVLGSAARRLGEWVRRGTGPGTRGAGGGEWGNGGMGAGGDGVDAVDTVPGLEGVVAAVQRQLQGVPDAHFERLREALQARLS